MTTSDGPSLVDTNVLVYAADTTAEYHEPARRLRERGLRGEVSLAVSPQVLMEFFAVVTNARRVTNPRRPGQRSRNTSMPRRFARSMQATT